MQFPPGDDIADALRDALESGTRRIYLRVEFDWNRDGNFDHLYSDLSPIVQSVADDRQVTGDLPEQVNTLVGYASAEMTLKLAGERRHGELPAHQMFSPYLQTSPLPRKNIIGTPVRYSRVVETALGDVPVRQFTGWIREFQLEREDNVVTIIASDVLDLTTSPVTLPMWSRFPYEGFNDYVQQEWVDYDDAAARTRPIDMTWVVEEAFRQGGSPSGPPTRPSAAAYWSCNGSYLPSVGTPNDLNAEIFYNHSIRWQPIGSPPFRNGIYGLESVPSNVLSGQEHGRRKNQGMALAPRNVLLPVDGGPNNVTLGFNAWVRQEQTSPITNIGSFPYSGFRFLSAKYYFRRLHWAQETTEMLLTMDHAMPQVGGSIEFYVFPTGQIRILCRQVDSFLRWWWLPNVPTPSDGDHLYFDVRVAVDSNGRPTLTRAIIGGQDMLSQLVESGSGNFRWIQDNIIPGGDHQGEFGHQVSTMYTSVASSHVQLYLDSTENIEAEDAAGWDNPEGRPARTPDGKPLAIIPAGAQMDLTHIPNTFRVPAWDLLKDLSSAEFAVMHTDEWGTKYWIPNYQARIEREHALSMADARGLLIHDDRLLSFMVNPSEDQYRNTITVGFSESWAEPGTVWTPSDWRTYQMGAGEDITEFVPVDNSILVPSIVWQLPDMEAWPDDFEPTDAWGFRNGIARAVLSANSSRYTTTWLMRMGPNVDGRRGFTWRRRNLLASDTIQFTPPPYYTYEGAPAFRNAIWMQGWQSGQEETGTVTVSDDDAVAERGIRELVLDDHPWRNWRGLPGNGDGAYGVAESLLRDTLTPAPLIDGVEIPADPRLQLRDVVALTSEGGITGRIHAEVIGIHRTDTASESKDRLTLRVIETPAQWELGVPGLSELSETTTLG